LDGSTVFDADLLKVKVLAFSSSIPEEMIAYMNQFIEQ
jgi:hypothetical protein